MKFNKGDKLKVVRGCGNQLVEGSIVTVYSHRNWVYLQDEDGEEEEDGWAQTRFELVEKHISMQEQYEEAVKNIGRNVSWNDRDFGAIHGVGIATTSSVIYKGYSEAVIERLENDGVDFCVFYIANSGSNTFPVKDATIYDVVEVELNSQYKANVSKDTIVVGCQTFPVSILDKLNEAYAKVK